MDMAKMKSKYKNIYRNQVLPKKSVTKNTPKTYGDLVKVYDEFSIYHKRANEQVLKGEGYGEWKKD